MSEKDYQFDVTGGFSIDGELEPELSCRESVMGFKLPSGETARLVVALEIESEDATHYKYVTSEKEMDDMGFRCLDYDRVEFRETA